MKDWVARVDAGRVPSSLFAAPVLAAILFIAPLPSPGGPSLFGASSAKAQTVRGQVVTEGEAALPVRGAFVSLVDPNAARVDAAFTDAGGYFQVEADTAGIYRLFVQRIGYVQWISDPMTLAAGEERSERFSIPVEPIRLADLEVGVSRQCISQRENEVDVWTAWEEARKALETTVWAQGEGRYRFDSNLYERHMGANLDVKDVRTRKRSGFARAPFYSLSGEELANGGYLREQDDGYVYLAPDAEALLSDSFEDTHCFGLRRADEAGEEWLGIAFEPVADHDRPDISGVLWLDEETAELRRVEFRYVNLPWAVDDRNIGGRVDFQRLPNDAFVVRSWRIRMPELRIRRDFAGLVEVLGYDEEGGELIEVFTPQGDRVNWRDSVLR